MNSPEKVSGVEYDTEQELKERVVIEPKPILPTQFEVPKNIHFSTITQLKNSLNLSNLDTRPHFNNENINISLTQNELNELKNEIDKLSSDHSKINKIKEITTSQTIVIDKSKNDRITLQQEITEKLYNFDITNVKSSLDIIERLKDPQDKAFLTNFLLGVLEGKGYSITLNDNKIEVNSNKQGSLKDELKNLFNNYIESSNFDINTFKNAILYRTTTLDNYVAANTDLEGKLIVDKMNSKTYYDFLLKKYNLDAKFWPSDIEDIKNHTGIDKKDKTFMISYYQKSFEGFPIDQSIKQFKEKEVQVKNNMEKVPAKDKADLEEKTKIIDNRSINQRTGDFLRDPFREINLIMGKAGGIGGLAILGAFIYFMFKKPKEIFGGIAVWGLLKGLGVMDEIGNTFDGDYNERIAKGSKKAFDWAEEKFKKIPGIDINFSSNLIERGKDWFNFKDVKIGNGDDAKSVIDTDFTDLYNISEKDNFKDSLFVGGKNVGDKKIKALKGKLEELYNKGIGIYKSKDKFFEVIQGKDIMEVEALVDKKEQENKKSSEENPNSGKPETEKEIDITSTTNSEKYELKEIHKFSLTGTLALLYSDIISKTRNLNNLTNKGFNSIIQTINKIKNDEDYKKKSVEERQEIDIGLTQRKTFYRNQLNKVQTKLLDSFIAGISDNLNSIETYLNEFKNKFSDISTYSKEELTEFKNKFEEYKKTDKYKKLSDDTKIKINIMLTEIRDKFEEKFKNMLTILDQELDLNDTDSINLDTILTDNKTYSKDELKTLKDQIKTYKDSEKFRGFDNEKQTKIITFLDSLLEKYNDKLLSQEKSSFIDKLKNSKKELLGKFNKIVDKTYNPEEPGEKQRQITEFDKKLEAKITGLDLDKVSDINKLEKLAFEYKLFETILKNYLDGTKKGDITKFIDGYVFNDNKTYKLDEKELLDKVKNYDLDGNDLYDNQRKKNKVFKHIETKVNEFISSIPENENEVLVNLYKKYLDNELTYSISSIKIPLRIGSITIEDIDKYFSPRKFDEWKKSLDYKISFDDKIINALEESND